MLFGYRSRPIFVLLLSQRFKSSDFVIVFMQDSAPCSAHRAKATLDDLRNVVPDFAVEKTSGSIVQQSQNMMCTNSAHFQLTLLKATNNFVFFCILTCNITLLSISLKVEIST